MKRATAMNVLRAAAVAVVVLLTAVWALGSADGVVNGRRHAREVALVGSIVVVVAGVRCWQLRRRPERALIEIVVLVVGSFVAWACFESAGPSRPELTGDGDVLRTCVERYRERTGRYPQSLEESGCTPRWNGFGGWQYSVDDAGSRYWLRAGDYAADGFELSWRPDRGWLEDG